MKTIYRITTREWTVITSRIIPEPLDIPEPFTPFWEEETELDEDDE